MRAVRLSVVTAAATAAALAAVTGCTEKGSSGSGDRVVPQREAPARRLL